MRDTVVKAHKLADGRVIVEQPDGVFREARDATDWEKVGGLSDAEIEAMAAEDDDALPTDEAYWKDAQRTLPKPKKYIHAGFDADVIEFFKAQGRGYQTRMNAILRHYMESHKRT